MLNVSVRHNDYGIGHCQGFLLIVSYIDKGYAGLLLDILKLFLHILAELQVKRTERFVKQKHLRFVNERSGYRNPLLLTARQCCNVSLFKALEINELQHFLNAAVDLVFLWLRLFYPQTECYVFIDIQVREKRVSLKYGVYLTFVRLEIVDAFSVEKNVAFSGVFDRR